MNDFMKLNCGVVASVCQCDKDLHLKNLYQEVEVPLH